MKQVKRIVHFLVLLSLILVSMAFQYRPVNAAAEEILVTTPNDENGDNPNACSLREAIISANENTNFGGCTTRGTPGTDFIRLPASTRPYALTQEGSNEDNARTGDLDIREPVQIFGSPSNPPTVSAGSARDRVFHILTHGAVVFRDMSISGGDYVGKGGGIYIDARLGTANYHPQVTLSRVDLLGNHAADAGGGMVVDTGTTAYVSYSEISNNTAPAAGGILNEGTLVVDSSLLIANKATVAAGAITANSLTSTEKTVVVNTTITQNDAPDGSGAGISVSSYSVLEVLNSTIVDNQGIGLEVKSEGIASVKNTIIARQKKADVYKANCKLEGGAVLSSLPSNLTTDTSCNFPSGDITTLQLLGVDPSLGSNGGPTLTYALQETSPAVDRGDNNGCPSSDQRLLGRPAVGKQGGVYVCDIGSYERNGRSFTLFLPFIRR